MRFKSLDLLAFMVAVVVWFGAITPAHTVPPLEYNVLDYGAKCVEDDPAFDSKPGFQSALNAARDAGGGIVRVPHCRFRFNSSLEIDDGVALAGAGVGPYDPNFPPGLQTPATTTVGPTLLPTASTLGDAFIHIVGANSAVQDLIFFYPDQISPSAPPPPVFYPPTIVVHQPAKISRCLFSNSFKAIDVRVGRVFLEKLHIGAFQNDIIIDNALDVVRISQVTASVFWDYGVAHPACQPSDPPPCLDAWALANGTGITSARAHSLSIHDLNVHYRNIGIALTDHSARPPASPCPPPCPDCGYVTYGKGSDIDLDVVNYGVYASATQPFAGFEFTNLSVGPSDSGQNMIWLPDCETGYEPRIVVGGGSTRGTWVQPLKVDAGILRVRDIVGLSPIGRLPALGMGKPSVPASTVPYVSNLPAEARVMITSTNVTEVRIGGQLTGLTRGMFLVSPGESIALTYSSGLPTWEWFLN